MLRSFLRNNPGIANYHYSGKAVSLMLILLSLMLGISL